MVYFVYYVCIMYTADTCAYVHDLNCAWTNSIMFDVILIDFNN